MSAANCGRLAHTPDWCVRRATPDDVLPIAAAATTLLEELGAEPPERESLLATATALVGEEAHGTVLVASSNSGLVGFLGASWVRAIRIPGTYGLIQELWIHPAWREQQIGSALISSLVRLAESEGIERLEVGLPGEAFRDRDASAAFYQANGFAMLGPRMRRPL